MVVFRVSRPTGGSVHKLAPSPYRVTEGDAVGSTPNVSESSHIRHPASTTSRFCNPAESVIVYVNAPGAVFAAA